MTKWFADRSDLILLLFDAHKLDISDEFKNVIDTIRRYNDDKIRCVLNKADGLTREQLVRVYGSLMWSMGKIFDSPEVVRVYTGSYWNGALLNNDFERMFEKDEQLLVQELLDLPRCAAERKVNQMVNRIRLVKVHVCILGTLRELTPRFVGKRASRDKSMEELDVLMERVRVAFDLSKGDMPDPHDFAKCLENFPDFSVFPPIDKALIKRLDRLIEQDIPEIVSKANIAASDVRMGHRKKVEESLKLHDKETETNKTEQLDVPKKDKVRNLIFLSLFTTLSCPSTLLFNVSFCCLEPCLLQNSSIILTLFVKVISSFILLFLIAQTAHYWSFAKTAYSLTELQRGCLKILKRAVDTPVFSDMLSKFYHPS